MSSANVSLPDADGFVTVSYQDKQPIVFRFTWRRLYDLQQALGDDFVAISTKALTDTDIGAILKLASTASGLTEQEIEELAFPVVPIREAITHAWQHAFFGGLLPEPEDEGDGKKSLRVKFLTYWRSVWKRIW